MMGFSTRKEKQSIGGYSATKGRRLYEHIISKDNILLAFQNIKANTGSKTSGTDGITIDKYKIENVESYLLLLK